MCKNNYTDSKKRIFNFIIQMKNEKLRKMQKNRDK